VPTLADSIFLAVRVHQGEHAGAELNRRGHAIVRAQLAALSREPLAADPPSRSLGRLRVPLSDPPVPSPVSAGKSV
jgi:hypothetical protein